MNKPAPLLSAAGLFGGVFACLLALLAGADGQQPEGTPASVDAPSNVEKTDESAAPANSTEILASQGATFAAKERVAIFTGDVRVKDPRFVLACDKLTVYLAKGTMPGVPSASPAETPAPTAGAKLGENPRGSGIERAVAEGHVIIVQKHAPTKPGEEEKVSVGRADIAEFDNKTGETTLRGLPKVEQNGNFHEALSRQTVMYLGSDNSLRTVGPSRTRFIPREKESPSGAKPGTTTPSASASPTARRTPTSGTQN